EREVAGDVRLVRDRPVRVPLRVRALAAAVRLDPVADLAGGVGGRARARLERLAARQPLPREVPPGRLPVVDAPLGPDDARIADVDHVRALDVEPDAEACEEDRGAEQRPDRPARRAGSAAVPDADPRPAEHHPDEERIEERHSREHVPVVEEPQRRRRREQEEQVEVPERERPPEVAEPDEEDETERTPDPWAVDGRAAECAGAAPRHPPRDLRPRPRLRHVAARVDHLPLGDLAGRDVAPAPPDLHRPFAGLRVVLLLVAAPRVRVAREPRRDLRIGLEGSERLLLREGRLRLLRDEGRPDQMPLRIEDRRRRSGAGRRERRGGEYGGSERGEGGGEETPHHAYGTYAFARRNDQSLFPTKLSGVTKTIAIACAGSLSRS